MRKKYLSALLFGALLLASAGTFTSCSDYDDDIKNLQEQINTVVSDLESLKTKVDGLGGYVTDVKVENGKLVVTANGSTVSYDLPAGGSSEVANIEIKNGHLYVNGTDKGSVGSTVTVNENGELVIDGEVSDLKVGTEVIIKDSSNGMYTISIDGQTIQLPMASANIQIELPSATTFTETGANTGIQWGKAAKDIEWDGPLGDVKQGALLVGQISTINVDVVPAAFDLGATDLKLVDSEGNEAAVEVKAVAVETEGPATDTRAASSTGKWTLSVKPTAEATADNFATIYTYKEKNVAYALQVNGTVVTGYKFLVDTRTVSELSAVKALTANAGSVKYKGEAITGGLPVGDCTLTYDAAACADAYLKFEGTNVELAKKLGVEVNGMTVKVTEALTKYNGTLKATVYVLDVTGKVSSSSDVVIKAKKTTVDDAVTAEATAYKVAYEADGTLKNIEIDLGSLISDNMTNDEIEAVTAANQISFSIKDDMSDKFISSVRGLDATALRIKDDKVFTAATNSLAEATKLVIPTASIQTNAEVGSYTLVMTVKDAANGNEIKKFEFPISISLPTFDELFKKSAAWDGNTLKVVAPNSGSEVQYAITETLSSDVVNVVSKIGNFSCEFIENDDIKEAKLPAWDKSANRVKYTPTNLIVEGAYVPVEFTVIYNVGGKLDVKSTTSTLSLSTKYADAPLKFYAEGKEAAIELKTKPTAGSTIISAFKGEVGDKKDGAGLALIFNDAAKALISDGTALDNNLTITASFDAMAGSNATLQTVTDGNIKLDSSASIQAANGTPYTTVLTITIEEDNTHIKTTHTIPVKVSFND